TAAITGVVLDQTGGVLVGANVELISASNAILQAEVSDASGQFHFSAPGSGRYDIRTTLDGFKTTDTRVNVQPGSPRALRIVMPLAVVKQEVTVSNVSATVDTSAASNVDAVTLDQDMLGGLPMLDQNYIAMVSRFLDAGALGTGGPTIVVNGM